MNRQSLQQTLDRIGLRWVSVLLVSLMSSLIYLLPALWQTWTHDGPTLVTPAGFVAGHDFVAFYAASKLALGGEAAMVYDRGIMMATQTEVVGSTEIGYLAFFYPPTYLLLIAPLATLSYLPALALWQALPLALMLAALRRIAIPSVALLMALGAPAVAQSLFAGQNGVLLAVFLGGGLMFLGSHPLIAGILLGLATVKPQLIALLAPALIAGRNWKALAMLVATSGGLVALSAILFGVDIWSNYLAVPGEVREFLARGQLPWPRMPTLYAAIRLGGFSDLAGMAVQFAGLLLAVVGISWAWWQRGPADLRIAAVLAGAPLATPFMYDYDLPFMLFALAIYIADGLRHPLAPWEKVLVLIVWLQPIWWWWQLVEVTGVSVSPAVYAAFFVATLYRTKARTS